MRLALEECGHVWEEEQLYLTLVLEKWIERLTRETCFKSIQKLYLRFKGRAIYLQNAFLCSYKYCIKFKICRENDNNF